CVKRIQVNDLLVFGGGLLVLLHVLVDVGQDEMGFGLFGVLGKNILAYFDGLGWPAAPHVVFRDLQQDGRGLGVELQRLLVGGKRLLRVAPVLAHLPEHIVQIGVVIR